LVGDDLDVWLNVNQGGTWTHVFDPAGNGQNLLTDHAGGGVGLAASLLASPTCEDIKIGYSDGDNHAALDDTIIDEDFDSLALSLTYDNNGNLTDDGICTYKYDAWNRLVEVQRKAVSVSDAKYARVARYTYDGLGRRIVKEMTNCASRGDWVEVQGQQKPTTFYYYYAGWQLLEVRNGSDQAERQFVWGATYIDEAIVMDVDTDNDGDCLDFDDTSSNPDGGAERYFYCQDANWNVIALRHGSEIVERYEYDPYGSVRIFKGYDSAEGHEDLTVVSDSIAGNPFLFAGYFYDNETGLYHVRHRMYSPTLQRWLQRDPEGYIDGMSTYVYTRANPVSWTDAAGTTLCWDPKAFLKCIQQMGCDAKYQRCIAVGTQIFDECMAAADRFLDWCLGACKGNCKSSTWCSARCSFCYLEWGIQKTTCRSGLTSWLASCDLQYIACQGGCYLGSIVCVKGPCPPGMVPWPK